MLRVPLMTLPAGVGQPALHWDRAAPLRHPGWSAHSLPGRAAACLAPGRLPYAGNAPSAATNANVQRIPLQNQANVIE